MQFKVKFILAHLLEEVRGASAEEVHHQEGDHPEDIREKQIQVLRQRQAGRGVAQGNVIVIMSLLIMLLPSSRTGRDVSMPCTEIIMMGKIKVIMTRETIKVRQSATG